MKESLEVFTLQNGRGISDAPRHFNVPRSTLSDHYHEISKSNKVGRGTIFSAEEEKLLVDAFGLMPSVGVGIGYFQMCKIIVEYQKLKKM